MDEQVLTTEPTIVETSAENTTVPAENSAVINNATPMDANVTYNSLPKAEYQPSMSPVQNMVNEAIQVERSINQEANAGKAMNQFLTQGYDYDKNEAGSYWVAGAINDNDTQMNFLQTLINEEMYDEMDLQKYYYDTNIATARAYAAQKKKEVAYGFYQAAQQRAYAEGELTGWYMPAEGRYLLGQYTVAQNTLEDPDATVEDKAKASRISKTAEEWFAANQITTRGIKCLAMMNYEENVRHNTVMGELQKQANAIAGASASYSSKIAQLNLKDRIFQLEEEELQRGIELTHKLGLDDKDYIGHHQDDYEGLEALRGYDNVAEMLYKDADSYASVVNSGGTEWVNNILKEAGLDPTERFLKYTNDQDLASMKAEINASDSVTQDQFSDTRKTDSSGHAIKFIVANNEVIAGYFEDGNWVPITNENATFSDGKSIKQYFENKFGKDVVNFSGINAIEIDGEVYSFGNANTSGFNISYTSMSKAGWKKFTVNNAKSGQYNHAKVDAKVRASESTEGTTTTDGKKVYNLKYTTKMDEKHLNEYLILEGTDEKGKATYYSIESDGELKEISEEGLKDIGTVEGTLKDNDRVSLQAIFGDSAEARIIKSSFIIGEDPETGYTYMALPNTKDNTIEYYAIRNDNGKYSSITTTNLVKVKLGITEQDIINAGFKVPNATPVAETYNTLAGKYNTYSDEPTQKTSEVTSTSTGVSVTPGGKGTEYKPELTNAKYNKYEMTEDDGSPVLTALNKQEKEDLQKNKINKVVI